MSNKSCSLKHNTMQSYKKMNGNLINICKIRYYRAKACTVYEKEHKKRINKDHISRHSFAKMAKDEELDNLEVKALLAHSNLATTRRYMGEFDTAHNDAALEKVFLPTDERSEVDCLPYIMVGKRYTVNAQHSQNLTIPTESP